LHHSSPRKAFSKIPQVATLVELVKEFPPP
jgi:hypothetical protein